jgi:hypothetical protein
MEEKKSQPKKLSLSNTKQEMLEAYSAILRQLEAQREAELKPEHIKPPPKNAKWNHIVDLYTKWHRKYFYFCAEYACPGPSAMSPYFEMGFARLKYTGGIGGTEPV